MTKHHDDVPEYAVAANATALVAQANCNARDGLTQEQATDLQMYREAIAMALNVKSFGPEAKANTTISPEKFEHNPTLNHARKELLKFYKSLPEIKNGENVIEPEQAALNDFICIRNAHTKTATASIV